MAGLTITVGGTNITAYVPVRSIMLESEATHLVGVARFDVRDHTGTVAIAAKDAVVIADDGTTLFSGEVVEQAPRADGVAVVWHVVCQDNNILLDETVVESETYVATTSDSDIIDDLFDTYRSDIDSETYVATIDASMEEMTFAAMTLREIMDEMCRRTGGRYYVDKDKKLHYFTTEVNAAAFGLSTSPDNADTFGFGGFRQVESASQIVNKVFVQGEGVSDWAEDAASILLYGERHGVSRDQRITTAQGVADRAAAILAAYKLPRNTYECWTEKDGLAAGQSVAVVHATLGIDDTFYIRTIKTVILSDDADTVRRHYLTLNDEPIVAEIPRRNTGIRIMNLETSFGDLNSTVFDTDAPAAPVLLEGNLATGVDLDADGHQIVYINVTWGSVADADLDHYQVQVATAADFSGYTITRTHPADGDRQEQFRGLPGNTLHYVRVRAVDWVGNASAWSDTQSITTDVDGVAPAQVADLAAAGARTLIGLSWTANSEADLAGYEVERAPDESGSPGAYATVATVRTTFYIDEDHSEAAIAAGTTYWYRVRAVDTSGNTGDYAVAVDAALSQIGSDTIATDAIIAAKIAADAVTAEKIDVSQLSAISADMGTITAGTVTGATIRTAASGARIVLDSTDGIQAYNAADVQTVQVLPSGAGWIGTDASIAWNTAGGVTIDGGLLVDGTIVATALTNQIGAPLFTAANGLALWGPYGALTATAWMSSRGQTAVLSGALHTEQGAWPETRGLVVDPGITNIVTNPSFAVNVTDYWSVGGGTRAQNTSYYRYDGASCAITSNATAGGPYIYKSGAVASPAQDAVYSLSAWVLGSADTAGQTGYVRVQETGGAAASSQTDTAFTLTRTWQRVVATRTIVEADRTGLTIAVRCNDETNTHTFYVDGVQLEAGLPTSTAIGTMGAGYAWSGTAHNSTTVRTVTVVNPTTHVGLLSSNATWTVATWVRVPYAADATWNTYPLVWDARGADNNNRAYVWFDQSTDTWEVYINGGFRLSSAAQTFAAGAWVYLVVTADFTNDAYALYVDGALVDTDTTALTVPVLTAWRLGSVYDGTYQCGFTIAEYAVFDALLTADEIAALYAFNKPLVDTGAIDKPGIYLYDGQFRLASNSSGARIEMTNAEIAGYDSGGTKQFYLRATDGVGCAGAGAVRLDSTGLVFDSSTGISSTCAWKSGATTYGRIYALHDAGPTYHALYLNVPSIAALDSVFWVDVDAPAGYEAAIHLSASNGTDVGGLEIYDDAGTFTARLYSTEHVLIQCGASDYIALSGGYTYSTYDIRVSAIGGIYVGGDVNVDSGDVWCTGEISTDGGTTKWDLGGYSVGAPTIEGYLTVVVNGSTYRLAAEAV